MEEEIEFLEYIYRTTKSNQESILRLLKEIDVDENLYQILKAQLIEYKKILNSSKKMIERRKEKVDDISILTKLATYMGVKLNITDKDDMSSVAKMLIQGSTVTINQIVQKLQEYSIKSKYIHNLTNRLIAIEKNNIKNLEKFS